MAPRDVNLEIAQGHTATDLQEWRQVDALTDDVVARSPTIVRSSACNVSAKSMTCSSCV